MPVISKQKFYVDAKLGEVERVIKYSSKTAKFSADLPPEVVERLMLTDPYVSAKTEYDCGRLWEAKIREYNEAKRETSTVILFRIKLNGLVHPEGRPDYHVADHNADLFPLYKKEIDWNNVHALGMVMEWGVYTKEFYQEKTRYSLDRAKAPTATGFNEHRFEDNINKKGHRGEIKEIPFTQERLQWFIGIHAAYAQMIMNVQEKLHKLTADELLNLVDKGNFKLLGN